MGPAISSLLPFTTFDFPIFSRDGTQLAVSALDPALPIQRSQNVFSLSTTTGAVNELTFYGDLVSDGVIIYNSPNYKAFSPGLAPTDDRESAILRTLAAGAYTVIVQGKNSTTGVGLIEAYNLQ